MCPIVCFQESRRIPCLRNTRTKTTDSSFFLGTRARKKRVTSHSDTFMECRIFSLGCPDKGRQARWLRKTEMHSLTVQEDRSPKSRHQQAWFLPEAPRGKLPDASPQFRWLLEPLTSCLGLWLCPCRPASISTSPFSSCLCLSTLL